MIFVRKYCFTQTYLIILFVHCINFVVALGGGIAMITGAQTEIPAIALSGPNTMISRKTYFPQITPEALDKYTFNIGK